MKGERHVWTCAAGHRLEFEDDGIASPKEFAAVIRKKVASIAKGGCDAPLEHGARPRRCGKPTKYVIERPS